MSVLSLNNMTVFRETCPVVDSVTCNIGAGELVGLIGPNGAGKTTLMRASLGLLPYQGQSTLAELSAFERAKHVAWLPQAREIAWPMSVAKVVALGRIPHAPSLARLSQTDRDAVMAALEAVGLQDYYARTATELSGGEQARVLIARTLAQNAPLIMADEPIAGLDPAAQISTLRAFETLNREGKSVLVSLHDLGLAARHCSRLLLTHQGRLHADGAPEEVLTPENIQHVFGVRARLENSEDGLLFHALEVLQ